MTPSALRSAPSAGPPGHLPRRLRRSAPAALRVRLWAAMVALAGAGALWIPSSPAPAPPIDRVSVGSLATPAPDAEVRREGATSQPAPAPARTPAAEIAPGPAATSAGYSARIARAGGGALKSNQPSKRNTGSAAVLAGRVCLLHVFLSDPQSSWTPSDRAAARRRVAKAIGFLYAQGKRYRQSFSFVQQDLPDVRVGHSIPTNMFHSPSWIEAAVRKTGHRNAVHLVEDARRRHAVRAALLMVHVNKRATSYNLTYYRGVSHSFSAERVVMFTRYADGRPTCAASYAHEVLHSFGAGELYFPFDTHSARKRLGRKYFPNDVMCRVDYDIDALTIGEYTAYRVGWLDVLDPRFRVFQD